MHEMFGDDASVLGFLPDVLRRRRRQAAERRAADAARGRARRAPGRDVEEEIELSLEDAYHGAMRRFSHPARRPGAQRRRPHSGRRRRRLARARRRARANTDPAARRPATCTCASGSRRNAQFERKGRDLYTHVPIPLTTAVLGGEADVKTLAGKSLRLKIPPTTQNAQVFRLKGHGMPVTGKTGEHGDLYATVDVQLPRELTPEQRTHFEALQELRRSRPTGAYVARRR